jgi:hypothetical protein
MKTQIIILLFLILGFISCKKEKVYSSKITDPSLKGYWINLTIVDTLLVSNKSARLKDNAPGFAILDNGKFIEREIAGWCGTPPINYSDFDGKWDRTDSIINIKVGFWGGNATYKWKILLLNDSTLKIYRQEQKFNYTQNK